MKGFLLAVLLAFVTVGVACATGPAFRAVKIGVALAGAGVLAWTLTAGHTNRLRASGACMVCRGRRTRRAPEARGLFPGWHGRIGCEACHGTGRAATAG